MHFIREYWYSWLFLSIAALACPRRPYLNAIRDIALFIGGMLLLASLVLNLLPE